MTRVVALLAQNQRGKITGSPKVVRSTCFWVRVLRALGSKRPDWAVWLPPGLPPSLTVNAVRNDVDLTDEPDGARMRSGFWFRNNRWFSSSP